MNIFHNNQTFATLGTVVYFNSNMGMGIKFLKVQHEQVEVLRGWLNNLKSGLNDLLR